MKLEQKMGSKSMEDFSFPIISNPFSNLMPPSSSSSSSLWRVSSRVFHHEEEEEGRRMEVRSLCEEGFPPTSSMSRREIDVECVSCLGDEEWEVDQERMDFLWEDFNHEEEEEEERESKTSSVNYKKEICIVKKQGSKIGTRRPSSSNSSRILVMGKLLKGLLSIKKSAQLKIMKTRF